MSAADETFVGSVRADMIACWHAFFATGSRATKQLYVCSGEKQDEDIPNLSFQWLSAPAHFISAKRCTCCTLSIL